jgi:hypothetical protein
VKKLLLVLAGFFVFAVSGGAQETGRGVLPGYEGFWKDKVSTRISVFDLLSYDRVELPFLRNEIYARYGRPFVNRVYRDYFMARGWYVEKSDYSASWLSGADNANAAFILELEKAPGLADTVAAVMKNIEYRGKGNVLTFTSRTELVYTDPELDFGFYGIDGEAARTFPWVAVGDWILAYTDTYEYGYVEGVYSVEAYKLDHASRKITAWVSGGVEKSVMRKLIDAQKKR